MKNPPFAFHQPETLTEALSLLHDLGEGAQVLSGGQSLLPVMALRLAHPEHLIDVGQITGLDSIDTASSGPNGGVVSIGARVTHSQAEQSAVVAQHLPLVSQAIPYIGHRAIRNRGTICGSLAHADPAAELPAVALALGAEVAASSVDGVRVIQAKDLFTGFLSTSLRTNELITAVRFPHFPPRAAASVKELSRRHGDYAMVGLACAIALEEDGLVRDVALSFLGTASTPIRATEAEELMIGVAPTPELIEEVATMVTAELDPPSDNHASSAYRRHGAGVLTRRALNHCLEQIEVAA